MTLRNGLIGFLILSILVLVCYQWVDRPIAIWVHEHTTAYEPRAVTSALVSFPNPLITIAAAIYGVLGLIALIGRVPRRYYVLIQCCVSLVMGEAIKTQLKWVFGRPWPETWKANNPSFIRDHVYGFHWFHGGGAYDAFPSGHMTAAAATLSVLWIAYPRWRALYLAAGVAVGVALVGLNYHFFSDILTGAFVGGTVGWISVALLKADRSAVISSA
jgi:membrane-associated phospholipid phosphatase